MRRYRFFAGFALGLVLGVGGALVYKWDAGAAPNPNVKYRFDEKPDLGIIVHHPMQAGPKLREFRCMGGPKDCGPVPPGRMARPVEPLIPPPPWELPMMPDLPVLTPWNPPTRPVSVPEPAAIWLVGVGLVLLRLFRRGATPPRSRPR
jgi:hypothetical protein